MPKSLKQSFVYAFCASIYIGLVALFMNNANKLFGDANSALGVFVILTLFTLSALVVGGLLVGKPIMLYLDGKKKEAVLNLLAAAIWIFLFWLIALIIFWVI